jgi:quercetin dioxygenase-like cupin family protein
MTQIIEARATEIAIDPAILNLLPEQGSIELQHDAAGKVHHFHTHPVDEVLMIISGRLNFIWDGGERIVAAGDTILLPAGTLHQSEALEGGAIYAIATQPPAQPIHSRNELAQAEA